MPQFSYRCKQCLNLMSVVHGISEKPKLACRTCGNRDIEKVIRGSGFHITGPGVYKEGFSEYKPTIPTKDGKIFTGENE